MCGGFGESSLNTDESKHLGLTEGQMSSETDKWCYWLGYNMQQKILKQLLQLYSLCIY